MQVDRIRLQRDGRPAIDLHISIVGQWEPYILLDADGLAPPESELFYQNFQDMKGSGDGVVGLHDYEPRVITYTIKLNPEAVGSTFSTLRNRFYKDILFGAENNPLKATLYNQGNVEAHIYGFTKEIDVNLFTMEPQITFVMECPNPFLIGNPIILDHNSLNSGGRSVSFINDGTAMSGIELKGNVTNANPRLVLTMNGRTFSATKDLPPNGVVELDSSDYIFKLEFKGMDRAFVTSGHWPTVLPGNNALSAASSFGITFTQLKYLERFTGV